MIQRILALAAGFLVVASISGWGHEQHSPVPEQPQAAQAIRAVTTNQPDAARLLPADFVAVMHYRPSWSPTGPTRAGGGCSSPFGGTRYGFTAACRQHDLGYDLLRYANAKGQPLGPWARKAVDERFAARTQARCGGLGCRAMADLYTAMVDFNSWRQGYGTPVVESKTRMLLPVGAGLAAALLLGLLQPPRPRSWAWTRPATWTSAWSRPAALDGRPA
jgi:hypothetical protein